MKWLLCLLLFMGIFDSTCCNENRIVDGKPAPKELYKFLLKLKVGIPVRENGYGVTWHNFCSSTIISSRHVLTDAHCVVNNGVGPITKTLPLFIDTRPIEKNYFDISLKKFGMPQKVYIHRGYTGYTNSKYNDLAILEFPEYVNFTIDPVKLAKDYVDSYNDTAIAAGYGNYIYNATAIKVESIPPPELLHLKVGIHPYDQYCMDEGVYDNKDLLKYRRFIYNSKNKICAGNIPLERADHGDSGGPLLLERNNAYYQIGLFESLFDDPENIEKPGIYIRISSYCSWIEKVTKNEVKCVSLYELPPSPVPTTTKPQQPFPFHPKPKPKPKQITSKETTTKDPNDALALKSLFNVLLFICVLKLLF